MKTFLRLCLLSVGILGATAVAFAAEASLDQVKTSMQTRLPAIDQLKKNGTLGENAKGLVELRAAPTGDANLAKTVADENRDREQVYAALAKQTGSTADAVGRARAKAIAASSAAGVWLQREDGTWYRK